ncbi:unnamed protein product [Chironomus riparius]|uniref:Uncharacterized protein n=1 Tax=Chironomus riparius TaxID=315576 RepID=A0A9N9WT12_9DIPT|nr:unnamed protein product [Chironomus riparius]
MYHLISGLWNECVKINEYNVLILGLDNAGKSTFLESIKKRFSKGYRGGQRDLQHLWKKYYDGVHGIIYVIDSSDRVRIQESKELFVNMLKNEKTNRIPLVIVANKQDIEESIRIKEIMMEFDDYSLVGSRDCRTIAVSGLTGDGIDDAIKWLSESVKRHSVVKPAMNKK